MNHIKNRATIVIFKDKDDIYTLDSIQEFTILDDIKTKYSSNYKFYEALRIKSISSYKLTDLQEICKNYNIAINPNKKLKKDLYEMLQKFFK